MEITVATLNLHLTSDRWLRRRSLVVAELLDLDADLIALQQIAVSVRQGHWLARQLNARRADAAPYHYARRRRPSLTYYFIEAVGVLCRLPVVAEDWLAIGFGSVALRVNVELPQGETLDFVTTRLHSTASARGARREQVMRLMSWLDGSGSVRHRIVAGSFNESQDGPAIKTVSDFFGYRSAYKVRHNYDVIATFPTALNNHGRTGSDCRDYIFLSPDLKTVHAAGLICRQHDAEDPTLFPSDHVGLFAVVSI